MRSALTTTTGALLAGVAVACGEPSSGVEASSLECGAGPACEACSATVIPSYPSDLGRRYAVRIEPPTRPYLIDAIGYGLDGGNAACMAGLAHRVELYRGPGDEPPALPGQTEALVATLDVDPSVDLERRTVAWPLEPPLELGPNDNLFVAVTLSQGGNRRGLCFRACPTAPPDTDFLTSDLVEPFLWLPLNVPASLEFWFRGRAP